jgi:hypothetical protein
MEQENKSSVGGVLGTIIIIAIIIIGGLYFWGKRIEENKAKQNLITDFTPGEVVTPVVTDYVESEANVIKSVTPSDELDSIEADLNNTKLEDLSPELTPELQ